MRENIGEYLGVNLDINVFGALAINDRGEGAFTTHLLENTGSGALASFSFESLGLRHGMDGLNFPR